MGSPKKTVPATRFGGRRKCRLIGGFHGELCGGDGRAEHGAVVGKLWWMAVHREARSSSPE